MSKTLLVSWIPIDPHIWLKIVLWREEIYKLLLKPPLAVLPLITDVHKISTRAKYFSNLRHLFVNYAHFAIYPDAPMTSLWN